MLEPGCTIEGRLVKDEAPFKLGGVLVWASWPKGEASERTDEDGRFVLKRVPAGSCMVYVGDGRKIVRDLGLVCAPKTDVQVEPGPATTRVNLELTEGQIVAGHIRETKSGKAVKDGRVEACVLGHRDLTVSTVRSDEQGRYRLRLPPGQYELNVREWRGGRRTELRRAVSVKPGSTPGEVDFEIGVRPEVRGRVVDAYGRAVQGTVSIGFIEPVKTREDGGFAMPAPEGRQIHAEVSLALDLEKGRGRLFPWTQHDTDRELVITVEEMGSITGRVVDQDGTPTPDADITVRVELPYPRASLGIGGPPWTCDMRPDGTFTIAPVPVGMLMSLRVERGNFEASADLPDVRPNRKADAGEIVLEPVKVLHGGDQEHSVAPAHWNAVISGRVLDENGRPIVAARVQHYARSFRWRDTTDQKGRFRLTGLPADREVGLLVVHPGYYTQFDRIRTGQEDLDFQVFPQGYQWYGKPAPGLLVEKWLNSEPLSLEQLRGKVVLLHLGVKVRNRYADAVGPVRGALAKYADEGLLAIGVHQRIHAPREIGEEEIVAYLKRHQITFPFALDGPTSLVPDSVPTQQVVGNGAMYSTYGVKQTPAMFLIDKKGILRGSPTPQDLDDWIRRLLAE